MTKTEAGRAPADNSLVFVAGNAWDGMASTDRHIGLRLGRLTPVLYVDPPTAQWPRLWRRPLSEPAPGVRRMVPVTMRGMIRTPLRHLAAPMLALSVNRLSSVEGVVPRATLVATFTPVLARIKADVRALYATDDWVAGAGLMGVPANAVESAVRSQAEAADIVFAVSDSLAEQYRAISSAQIEVIPNGCDVEGLRAVDDEPWPEDVGLPRPIVGFVGNLSDRIDLVVLEAIAERGHSLLLVGPRRAGYGGARFDALVSRSNVQWVGQQPYSRIPAFLRAIDVGITPYTRSRFNEASSPLKSIEYLAAGRASVATDLHGISALGLDEIDLAGGPGEFVEAVEEALSQERTPEIVTRRRAAAGTHDWSARAAEVARLLGLDVSAGTS